MLFFKPKPKFDDILPPPPPTDIELEESIKPKQKFFDELVKPQKAKSFPEEEEFSSLVRDMGKVLQPEKLSGKKKAISPKKLAAKIQKKSPKQAKKLTAKASRKALKQSKKLAQIKKIQKASPKIKAKLTKGKSPIKRLQTKKIIEKPKGLKEDFAFELPQELEPSEKEIEFPDNLEEFDFEGIGKELGQETAKPQEVLEAQEEIKSAIDKIKKQERPSFLGKLFAKKESKEMPEDLMQETQEFDELSRIQNTIGRAREALMKLDLETAKKNYIEVMSLYNKIKPEDQAKVYNDIKELYFERKSAEELKV
ncbi:hypothetical protein HYX03_01815 [Candidatus Woesearchaeota archaeon]|nr:hypothetical protein [Candidatus Woesearchaeota archaeon]